MRCGCGGGRDEHHGPADRGAAHPHRGPCAGRRTPPDPRCAHRGPHGPDHHPDRGRRGRAHYRGRVRRGSPAAGRRGRRTPAHRPLDGGRPASRRPLLIALLRTFTRRTADANADYQRAQALIADRLTEALDGAETIRAARTGAREYRRVLEPLGALADHGRRTWAVYGKASGQSALLLPLLMLLVLAVGGLRLDAGAIGVGDLVAAARYAGLVVGIGSLTGALSSLARSRAAADRLDPLLALPPVPHRSLGPVDGAPGRLELRDVGVGREGRPLLSGVGLVVPGGSSLAVVGRSGSGKSVLAAVAGRLMDPDTGTVLLDGVPMDGMEPGRLRHEVTYAFARPALPGRTVGETIAFGARTASNEEVRSAAREARADAFVALLPQGYATPHGRPAVRRGTPTPRSGPRLRASGPSHDPGRRAVQPRHRDRASCATRARRASRQQHPCHRRPPALLGRAGGPGRVAGGRPGPGDGPAPRALGRSGLPGLVPY